jgi:hypothetical protein
VSIFLIKCFFPNINRFRFYTYSIYCGIETLRPEKRNGGKMERWKNGMVEKWNDGIVE